MRVDFLIGRTWKPYLQKLQLQYGRLLLGGNLLRGEELPPVSVPAQGDPAGSGGLQGKRLVFNVLSCQAGLSHVRAEGTCKTSGGFLPTQEKWGFAEVGKRCQAALGKGAVAEPQGTAMKGSLLMHWQALPSPLPSPGAVTGRLCPAPSWAQASQSTESTQHSEELLWAGGGCRLAEQRLL